MKPHYASIAAAFAVSLFVRPASAQDNATYAPPVYSGALRNPLMGISPKNYTSRATYGSYMALRGTHPWGTLTRTCIPWAWLENSESDGVDKIKEVSDRLFTGLENHNTKAMPRVYLYWPGADPNLPDKTFYMRGEFWPQDLNARDISSPEFTERLKRFIARLGEAWDNDPRIGIVEMGIIGKWGEQTDPGITPEMEAILGEAFQTAFKNKKIMTRVRPMTNFDTYPFGLMWDSFAHQDQLERDGTIIAEAQKWKVGPIGGETAYDWGQYKVQPGDSPTDSLVDPIHRDFIVNLARKLHVTQLGWVAEYDQSNPDAAAGAELLQKALGYRFVLQEVTTPRRIDTGKPFTVSFSIRNDGSAPFYEKWPVALFLLRRSDRQVVWQGTFDRADTSSWWPGDEWDETSATYKIPPENHEVRGDFQIPATVPPGDYVFALGVLDALGGRLPTLRFANQNYWNGGYHPIGMVGVGAPPTVAALDPATFDDPARDRSLHYINPSQTPEQRKQWELQEQRDPLALLRPVHWWSSIVVNGAKGSFELRDATHDDPSVSIVYDFTNVSSGGASVGVASDIRLGDSAQAFNFSARSDQPAELTIGFTCANNEKFEYRVTYDTLGSWQQFSVPLDAGKLLYFGRGEKVVKFPIVAFFLRVQNTSGATASGRVELGSLSLSSVQP